MLCVGRYGASWWRTQRVSTALSNDSFTIVNSRFLFYRLDFTMLQISWIKMHGHLVFGWFLNNSAYNSLEDILCWHYQHFNDHVFPIFIKSMDDCFSQQHEVDNQPPATHPFRDFMFSHSDISISRKSRLVDIRQLSIYGNVGTSFWWSDVLPDFHQPAVRVETRESGKLFSGSWIPPQYPYPIVQTDERRIGSWTVWIRAAWSKNWTMIHYQ